MQQSSQQGKVSSGTKVVHSDECGDRTEWCCRHSSSLLPTSPSSSSVLLSTFSLEQRARDTDCEDNGGYVMTWPQRKAMKGTHVPLTQSGSSFPQHFSSSHSPSKNQCDLCHHGVCVWGRLQDWPNYCLALNPNFKTNMPINQVIMYFYLTPKLLSAFQTQNI